MCVAATYDEIGLTHNPIVFPRNLMRRPPKYRGVKMGQPKAVEAPASANAPMQTSQSNSQLPTYISLFVALIALIGTVVTGYNESSQGGR
jgi:hypothetical protein